MIPKTSVWVRAQTIQLSIAEEIIPGFNIEFDKKIPETTQSELRAFVEWIENNYRIPITFWVDFDYKHYLIRSDGKHVGYLFYWSEFDSYPVFNNPANIPELRLAVRKEYWTIEEVLTSFIEAIMCYYAWICNEINDSYEPAEAEVEEILQEYLRSGKTFD
ncbi:MAG: hypothetical protein IJL08_00310 [Oscillospiraceae bacterium]|nr:hypothetical protein [Oscillospiraceae bacterium]